MPGKKTGIEPCSHMVVAGRRTHYYHCLLSGRSCDQDECGHPHRLSQKDLNGFALLGRDIREVAGEFSYHRNSGTASISIPVLEVRRWRGAIESLLLELQATREDFFGMEKIINRLKEALAQIDPELCRKVLAELAEDLAFEKAANASKGSEGKA